MQDGNVVGEEKNIELFDLTASYEIDDSGISDELDFEP